jgi:hypothetical protein
MNTLEIKKERIRIQPVILANYLGAKAIKTIYSLRPSVDKEIDKNIIPEGPSVIIEMGKHSGARPQSGGNYPGANSPNNPNNSN